MDEFDVIRRYLAPLATAAGAQNLTDDVAELTVNGRMAVTMDTIVEGIHFLADDPIESVGGKLVRVNVSDLVAKGAAPCEALLSLAWPRSRPASQIEAFAAGLGGSLAQWECGLVGGDTTSTDGPLVLSLTMTGACGDRGAVRRSGAHAGEDVWVTGVIGDGVLGLMAAKGELRASVEADIWRLVRAYHMPQPPPYQFAEVVAMFAEASIDVSDGLAQDAGHLCEASSVGIRIACTDVPLSDAGRRWLEAGGDGGFAALAQGGDDYQTLFTAAAAHRDEIAASGRDLGVRLSRIGQTFEGRGVEFMRADGSVLALDGGWRHGIGG